ncbi:MAG: 50S ribosomal protein L32 [Patescibacteria group bacterium]|nr:50S ribosomal protein L32 [Patescibacteria group bacterium]
MVVRMRHTRAHTGNRRSHHALANPTLVKCECGAMRRKHVACPQCGRYRGRVVIDVAAKAAAKQARQKAREGAEQK